MVRQPDAAAQRVGVGPAVPRSGGRDPGCAGRQGARRALRAGSAVACAAARDVQVVLQRALLRQRDVRRRDARDGATTIERGSTFKVLTMKTVLAAAGVALVLA